ncbi:hypothetical protein CROQUDRAFT_655551 [Cronartium quercuum f. sp. fusiforme G11]|uniref:Uroporphyrinogen decarboxylase n=1 Tax=Cronartium quercuum f. sp. fusiforme G11 TaxID=708437 RepID=A0A9P6TDN6_9BASI|nr:hypothetical protein CROQUDRAFT_655551 [Cronartium quercuum f. sp. fusiforme G11]
MLHPTPKNDLLIRAASGQPTERSPVWVMRQAGRYLPEFRKLRESHDFFEICRTPTLATEITMQPIKRYKGLLDGAIIFSDILVIPQALDMEIIMNPGPIFLNPIKTIDQMKEIINKPIQEEIIINKLKYVYDAIKLTMIELNHEIPLIGFVGAPWTLFAYMTSGGSNNVHNTLNGTKSTSFDHAKNWLFNQPDLSIQLLNKLSEICAIHLIHQAKSGCQILQVFDSWAGELSFYDFKTFCLPFLKKIVELVKHRLKDQNLPPIIIFAKGINQSEQIKSLSEIGYNTIGLDWKIQPSYAIKSLESNSTKIGLQGNLDPAILHSTPEIIKKYVKIMFDHQSGGFRGDLPHIANLGHGITPGVDPNCMLAFLEAVHEESRRARENII